MKLVLKNSDIVKALSAQLKVDGISNPITAVSFTSSRKNNGATAEVTLGRPGDTCITAHTPKLVAADEDETELETEELEEEETPSSDADAPSGALFNNGKVA